MLSGFSGLHPITLRAIPGLWWERQPRCRASADAEAARAKTEADEPNRPNDHEQNH